jgi:cell wall-associated NlpC family hydrolase
LASPLKARIGLVLSAVLALSALPAATLTGTVSADPAPSLREVEQRVDALTAKVDVAVEEYNETRIALAQAQRKTATIQARVAKAAAELTSVRRSMTSLAAAAYRSGGTDQLVQLINTSTPQTFLDRASSLDRIAAGQNARLAAAATARHRLDTAQREAAVQQAAQQAVAKAMAARKAAIQRHLDEQERLLGGLKAEERRQYLAAKAEERRRAAAAAAAMRASRSRTFEVVYDGPASGRAGTAVSEAYRKLGSPYKWAASGPDRFDCSGLTMWVWAKAGVSLPHSSKAQYAGGRKVSRGSLQPGDLVFYGSPIHHVGIYIGGGRMISAPQTGDVVKVQNAFRSDYVGAVRP